MNYITSIGSLGNMLTTLDMTSFVSGSDGMVRLHYCTQSIDKSKVSHMMVNHFKDVLQLFFLPHVFFLREGRSQHLLVCLAHSECFFVG